MDMNEIAKKSVRGTLILWVGNLVSTVINAASIILIARLLGPAEYGVYTLALVIPGLLQSFVDFGVGLAVIRYSAFYNSKGQAEEAKRFTINGILFLSLAAAGFSALNFVLAGTLSAVLLQRPDLAGYVRLMSLSILGNGVLAAAVSATFGWMRMDVSSLSRVAQSILRLALSPLLILLGLGVLGALTGQLVSLLVAGIFGAALIYVLNLRGTIVVNSTKKIRNFASDVKTMLRYGLPLYAGTLVGSLATYYATVILALIANNTTFGFYQAALNFLVPVTLVSTALVNALFPAFASVDGIGGDREIAFRRSYKFVAFLLTPAIFFLVSASAPLVVTLYGDSFAPTAYYLQLLALANLPIAFGYSVHSAFLNGFGRTKLTMLMNTSGAAALLAFAPLFSITLGLGIDGLILATFLSYLVLWIVGTIFAKIFMGATMDFRANGTILLISIVSYAGTLLVLRTISLSPELSVLLCVVVFFGIYFTLAPLTRTVTDAEINFMNSLLAESRLMGRLFAPLVRYERRILGLTTKRGRSAKSST